ncbi:hypothetical protein HELRODRAFT_170863 [Helobdella robusta]|uniref:Uncharacterized protein n=1 Tax=Helobdella robusta TaxID=6412 RepID=T1F3I9_HELRO|nr:hypothetical protein HELRODRAFT_170863 [Helobdella robusta]ESO06841.1 hypothetical protein HELRODRAFT_170863 [Helobdella robusta]
MRGIIIFSSHVTGPISSILPTVESSTFMAPPAIQGNEKFASTLKQCINKYNNYNYTNNNNNNEEQCCGNDVYQTTKQQLLQHLSSKQYKGVTTTMTKKSLYTTVEGLSLEDIEMSSSCHARYHHHHHKRSTSKDNNNCVGNYNINFDNIINNNIITTNNNINNKTLNSLKNCRRSNSCTNNSRDTFNKMYVEVDDYHKGNGEEEEDEMYRFNLPFKLKNSLLFGDRKNLSLNKLEKDEVGASGKNKALQIRSKSKKIRDGDDSDDENDSEDYDEDKGCARYKDKNKSRSRSSSSSSSSSLMSSITATTVKTALEVNELERNRWLGLGGKTAAADQTTNLSSPIVLIFLLAIIIKSLTKLEKVTTHARKVFDKD